MIEVENLHKRLGEQDVLKGVNLTVETGQVITLLGGSGSGKSVLLKNVVGLMTPDRGRVRISGVDVHRGSAAELSEVKNSIGMLFQGGALFDSMTVYENLAFPLREKSNLDESDIEERVRTRLELVDMTGAEEKYPAELSGGMEKRVALARALIRNPDVVFFDEPTTGLDPLIANAILRLIESLHEQFQFTGVIVTHDFEKVFQIVDKAAMLHNGTILAYGEPTEFLNSDEPYIRDFVREALEGPRGALELEATH